MRPSEQNQKASIRPNLMSSSKRGASNDGKILASLEPAGSPARARADTPPVHDLWRKGRNSLLLVLCVCLVWFTYDNATSFTFHPEPAVAVVEPKTPAQAAPTAQPEPMPAPAPAAAEIREELIAMTSAPVKAPALEAPIAPIAPVAPTARTAPTAPITPVASTAPATAAPALPERVAAIDRNKPAARPAQARKMPRPPPVTGPEAPTDSDVLILSAIVAQTHAAKAGAGR